MTYRIDFPWGRGLGTLGITIDTPHLHFHLDIYVQPHFGWFMNLGTKRTARKVWGSFLPWPRVQKRETPLGTWRRGRGWRYVECIDCGDKHDPSRISCESLAQLRRAEERAWGSWDRRA